MWDVGCQISDVILLRDLFARVVTSYQRQAAGWEETAAVIQGFEEVFAGDNGVKTAVTGDLAV